MIGYLKGEVAGIYEDRIILEDKSTDTEENLKNSLVIIGDEDAYVGIISNGFHEYRAMSIARNVGYNNVHSCGNSFSCGYPLYGKGVLRYGGILC